MKKKSGRNVLVVAAHPDDEILGCGGTIINHVKKGDKVYVMIMAEGITSRDQNRNTDMRAKDLLILKKTANHAAKIMGVTFLYMYDFPDNRMDSVDLLDVVKKIEDVIDKVKPSIVYTHYDGDVNVDHRIVHEAVVTACRPLPGSSVKRVLFFETLSSTEWQMDSKNKVFSPTWYEDITTVMETKIKALRCYKSELRDYPHPRSLRGIRILAEYRGLISGAGLMAEAFEVGRNYE